MTGKLVAVTGASGFLASTLVAQLLDAGYTVRGTVRDPNNAAKVAHLRSLPGAAERLSLHAADLTAPDAVATFTAVFSGCEFVFHCACPYVHIDRAHQLGEEFFVSQARGGTINVLDAAAAAGSVKRVVMTSSTAAVLGRVRPAGHCYDERDWNDEVELRTSGTKLVYAIGKTVQEKAAWQWMAAHGRGDPQGVVARWGDGGFTSSGQQGPDLVCLNPSLIGGPMLQRELNASSESVLQLAGGQKAKMPNLAQPWVHVADVAAAHVLAATTPAAGGQRYLLISSWQPYSEMCALIKERLPWAPVPTQLDLPPAAPGAPEPKPAGPGCFDASKAQRELGLTYRGLREIVADSCASLVQHGYLTPPAQQ